MIFILLWTQFDTNFTQQALWDDGKAEVAYYLVERTKNQYNRPENQGFVVGTYLVKHPFDTKTMSKSSGEGISAFKYALFYEFESGSYQYKRNYVSNLAQKSLIPFKASFTCFDWCSNTYRELAFPSAKNAQWLFRSDDYGNGQKELQFKQNTYPITSVPMLIRSLDFNTLDQHKLALVDLKGQTTNLTARLAGEVQVTTQAGTFSAQVIEMNYDNAIESMIGERNQPNEIMYLAKDEAKTLLKWRSSDNQYKMELLEIIRSAYWQENLYERLKLVQTRP